jgi:glycosyltransferase involved in cell wall biosynthesis
MQVHNHYRFRGGEDVMFEQICALLWDHGHEVIVYERHSDSVVGLADKLRAVGTSVYSVAAKRSVNELLRTRRPDLVHVHNLYPLVSPSILEACRDRCVPVVMRCPNYRLLCPTGLQLRNGAHCTRCHGGREYWCALTNCRGNLVESAAMALRNAAVRTWGLIAENVQLFVPPSECVKRRLVEAGIPSERIRVVPNTVGLPSEASDASRGTYVAFAGRLSAEKGVDVFLRAAARLPHIPFRLAGEGDLLSNLRTEAPANVLFVGQLSRQKLGEFYAGARISIVPSVWEEAFGLVAAESMAHGIPVIASDIGALPEIVDRGRTGLLFEPRNDEALAERIDALWSSPRTCREMGIQGREKVEREYTREVYYERILRVYREVTGRKEDVDAKAYCIATPA